jgi:TIR domain
VTADPTGVAPGADVDVAVAKVAADSPKPVFVSYSQPDRDCALQMVEWLESAGIGCWIAPRDIRPAADWAEEIIDAISAARVMVLVFSASSNDSAQVRREVERAVHKGVSVLPFRLVNLQPSKSLEYFLSTQHWLDAFPEPVEQHYRQLGRHLKDILGAAIPPPGPKLTAKPPGVIPRRRASIEDSRLRQVELCLAAYIGPVARALVKRALTQVSDFETLVVALAPEVQTDRERLEFIARCKRI